MRPSQYIRYISNLFLCFMFCSIALNSLAFDIVLKAEGRFYHAYGGSTLFLTPQEAIADHNQRRLNNYNACLAANGSCINIIGKPIVRSNFGALFDGVNYEQTTYYADAAWPPNVYIENQSSVTILFGHFCPEDFILKYKYESADYKIRNGAYCIKTNIQVSPPPETCPVVAGKDQEGSQFQFGNPVDAATLEKREHEIDYSTADGLLKLERFYVSQFQGWQFAVPSHLIDLSPDEGQQTSSSCYSASYRIGAERKSLCFEYMGSGSQKQVMIKTGKNNIYYFNKDTNGNLTGTNLYAGKLIKLSDNTWVHSRRDNSQDYYSEKGLLVKRKLVTGRHVFYGYANSKISTISDDSGRRISFHYDNKNRISSVTLPDSNTIMYEYDNYNNVTRVIWPDGTNKQYLYNESGLVSVDNPVSPFYLTGKINEKGIRSGKYKYVKNFQTDSVSTELADGINKFIVSRSSGITTPLGSTLSTTFNQLSDGTRLLRSQSQPAGSGCSASNQYVAYNPNGSGLVTQRKEFNGNVTQYGYNINKLENVRVEGVKTTADYVSDFDSLPYLAANATLPAGIRKISTEWHPDWRVKTRITEAKKLTTNIYNGQPDPFNSNQIVNCAPVSVDAPLLCKKVVQATTDANGAAGFAAVLDTSLAARVWQYTYNELGKTLTVSTPQSLLNNAVETTYEYYAYDSSDWRKGDLKQISNALGHTTQYTRYDANGRLLEMVDVNGVVSQFTYDLRGRLLTATQGNATTQYAYDPVGNLIRVTQPDGVYLEYDYDNASRLFRIRDQSGNKIEYTLDKASNITDIKFSDNAATLRYQQTRVYDALSRVQNIINANSNSTTLKYDASGNLTSEIDAKNQTTSQTYDGLDQFKQRTDALNGKINYTYDAQGNLTSVKDPRNNTTSYQYNAFGDLVEQTSPDTGKTTFTYDAAGNRLTSVDARNITQTYSYDSLGRLTSIQYPDAADNITYGYDGALLPANDSVYAKGKLTSLVMASMQWDFIYNAQGQLSKKRVQLLNINSSTEYVYNTAGRVTRVIYPSGRIVNYDYNTTGNISSIRTQANSNATETLLVSNIHYLPFGPAESFTYGNGLTHSQTYDLNYRLTSIQVGGILHRDYVYDAVSNITGITNNLSSTESQTYSYDALNRLTSALGGYGNLIYTYDAVGNRLTESRNNTLDTYSYATTSNKLNSITRSAGNRSFTYDAAGNPTQRTSDDNKIHSNSFNNANRLSSVNVNGSLAATYTYNPLGQRVVKTLANGTKEIYHYDEAGQLIAVTDQNHTTQREYIYWGNQQIALIQNNNVHYIHNDHLNTPQVVTNQTQQVVWMGNYEPFGKLAANQSNSIEIFSRFPGQYFDQETNLYYNYFRDYDPSIGRYIESDPIGLAGGINTYAYVLNNPLRYVDPTGENTYRLSFNVGWRIGTVANEGMEAAGIHPGIMLWDLMNENAEASYEEAQKDVDHENYHNTCDRPPPPGLNECELARWQYRQAMSCQRKRQDWEARWGTPESKAAHERGLANVKNRLKNAAEAIKNYCKCE
jgi:RHS repeat-associated protein